MAQTGRGFFFLNGINAFRPQMRDSNRIRLIRFYLLLCASSQS